MRSELDAFREFVELSWLPYTETRVITILHKGGEYFIRFNFDRQGKLINILNEVLYCDSIERLECAESEKENENK